jgi:predicted nucleic acid-binding protein
MRPALSSSAGAVYNGLIAAAALEAECSTLYSEYFQNGKVAEGRLTVRNPFVA